MRRATIGILIGLTLVAYGVAHAGAPPRKPVDWTQFRYDDAHTGVQPHERRIGRDNAKFLGLSWEAQLGDIVDYSSPAVVGGVVYLGTTDGRLWAYQADGCGNAFCDQPLWTSTSLAQIIDSPAVGNGIVYVGSQTNQGDAGGKLNAFAAAGCGSPVCAPLWQGDAGSQSILMSSPAVANGVVYVGAYDGALYAFNADGCGQSLCEPLWKGQTGGSIESTPTVHRGTVFVGSDDGNLYAFKAAGCGKATCKPKWTGALGGPVFASSPAVSNDIVYIAQQHAFAAFGVKGCGSKACAPLWQAMDNTDFFNGSPAIYNGRVYIPLESGIGVYDADGCGQPSCDKLWLLFGTGAQADIVSSPTIANGVVYAGRNTGETLAWDAEPCGQSICYETWKSFLSNEDPIVSSSPTVVNGKIYIGGAKNDVDESISGRIFVFRLQK